MSISCVGGQEGGSMLLQGKERMEWKKEEREKEDAKISIIGTSEK